MPNPNTQPKASNSIISQVAERVRTSDNVLVALSKDPSVDELSAALGLTFILDKMGKHATAIFSGAVPNAIEFLEPEKTFETNTNSLQDFIIALDKEKADHLRYKIDGDYVKVFITPYKTTIDESDMEFSHGDYNVDLVVALNVASAEDLDSALTEYGRIMHDASSINISANVPGKFGDIEWGDPSASSVSEMIFKLSQAIKEKDKDNIDKSTATALLAGIVAATNRFSNEHTSPETMEVASKLMTAGADQQLISSSIPVDILTSDVVDATEDAKEEPESEEQPSEEQPTEEQNEENKDNGEESAPKPEEPPKDPTNLEIHHAAAVDLSVEGEGEQADDSAAPKDEPQPEAEETTPTEDSNSEPESQPEEQKPEESQPEESQPEEQPTEQQPTEQQPEEQQPEEQKSEEQPAEQPAEQPPAEPAQDNNPELPPVEPEPAPMEVKTPDVQPVAPVVAPAPAPTPTPAQMPEPVEGPVEPPVAPIAPAEPEELNELSADPMPAPTPEEQAAATAELEQLVSPANATTQDTVISELQDSNVHVKKNITPPSEALAPPEVPKDYAAMMASELSNNPPAPVTPTPPVEQEPLVAPVPDNLPAMDTSPEPVGAAMSQPIAPPEMGSAETPAAPIMGEAVDNEYVDPLPMPDANTILPPPPAPFDPAAAPESVDMAPAPSAQEYVNQIQNNVNNEAVTTAAESMSPTISMPSVSEQMVEDNNPQPAAPRGGVMPDQIYPADPSAFQIPGM